MLKKFDRSEIVYLILTLKIIQKFTQEFLSNYRTYILENIVNVFEIRFEQDFLQELFENRVLQNLQDRVLLGKRFKKI